MRRYLSLVTVASFLLGCGLEPESADPSDDDSPPPDCEGVAVPFACSEKISAANLEGARFLEGQEKLYTNVTYKVIDVQEHTLQAKLEDGTTFSMSWPTAWPFPIEVDEGMEVVQQNEWVMLRFPRGELAMVIHPRDVFEDGFRLLDGTGTVERSGDCYWDPPVLLAEEYLVVGLTLRSGSETAELYPGDVATLGEWTYRMILSIDMGELACEEGKHVWKYAAERAQGARFLAHRAL